MSLKGINSCWLIAPVLLVGLALRVFNLGERNTWYDETSSILFAEKGLAAIVEATAADTMPPLYYFLLHYWLTLGNNLWTARSLSVVLSLGMVVVAFAIARRLFGARVALLAALLVALNPFQIYHGQEVRMYSLLGLSQLLAVYFFLRCLTRGSWGNWVGFALSQTVAMYTHNAAFLSLATLDAMALGLGGAFYAIGRGERPFAPTPVAAGRLEKEPLAFIRALVLANLAIVALFLPWLVYLPEQLAKVARAFWTETPGMAEVVRSLLVFTFNLPSPTPWSLPILLAVSLLLLALLAYLVGKAWRAKDGVFALAFAVSCFLGPVLLAALVSLIRPIYVERVLITSSVIYLVLLAWMMERLRPRFVPPVLLAAVILLSAWSLISYYRYDGFPRVAFPRIVDYLEKSVGPEDVVVHDNKLTFFPAYYLKRDLPQRFLADPEWSINSTLAEQTQKALGLRASSLEEATRERARVWFVVFRRALTEAEAERRIHENKDWLDRHFNLAREETFGDLAVYLFTATQNRTR